MHANSWGRYLHTVILRVPFEFIHIYISIIYNHMYINTCTSYITVYHNEEEKPLGPY